MAVINTHLFNISFSHQDLMKVLVKIDALSESVYPQDAKKIASNVKGVSVMEGANPYNEVVDELYHLCDILGIEKPMTTSEDVEYSIKDMKMLIDDIYQQLHQIQDVKEKLITEREDNLEVIRAIKEMKGANVNIDEINECKYLTYRFGRLLKDQVDKIQYYREYPFIYKKIREDEQYVWIVYAGLTLNIGEIDNIFYALSFNEIQLPNFVHGTFEEAYNELEEESHAMQTYIEKMDSYISNIKEACKEKLVQTFITANTLKKLYDKARYVVDFSHKESIFAFSSLSFEEIQEYLKDIDSVSLSELPTNMYDNRGIHGPVILNNHPFFQPFEDMVKTYAGSRYDATPLIASIGLIVSGILLGDIAVGITMFVLGLLLDNKNERNMGRVLNRLGIAIAVGGLFSGTIGYQWSLYAPIFSLPVTRLTAVVIWVAVIIGARLMIKGIQKITNNQR